MPHGHRRPPNSAFALLITVTLLAFLVLLLVSLASLTRVETQVASNNQQISQARQNALLALNIALGQLQKYAGPDQRITARSDMDPALAVAVSANGRWTGVYGSRVSADYDDTPAVIADKMTAAYTAAGADALAAKGSQAILLNWLVSGNENTPLSPPSDIAADGHVTLGTPPTIVHKPGDTAQLASIPVSPTIADTSVLLVGPNSVSAIFDRVSAPLVPIESAESALPGFAATGSNLVTVGRYAWWVGDENTKARVNLPLSASSPSDQSFVAAQRAGVELMDAVHPAGQFPAPASLNGGDLLGAKDYDPASPVVPSLFASSQLPMLSTSQVPALNLARQLRFHDLTTSSFSVLADTYAGGLKKDLSAMLATGAASPPDTERLYVAAGSTARDIYGIPTWGKLRSYVQNPASPGDSRPPVAPSSTHVGFYPVLTFAEVGLEYFRADPTTVRLAVFPQVVLWNPHSTTVRAHRYEFGINTHAGTYQLQGRVPPATTWNARDQRSFREALGTVPNANDWGYLRFVIDAEDIPPGESHVYSLLSPQTYQSSYDGPPAAVLRRTLNHSYALMPGVVITADPAELFRVAGNNANHIPVPPFPGSGVAAWRSNASAYIGDVSSTGPIGVVWSPETPDAAKPWFNSIAYFGVGGSPDLTWLQEDETGSPLLGTPGTKLWGVQTRSAFGVRQRWIANHNPRAAIRQNLNFQIHRANITHLGKHIAANTFDPSPDARASAATGLDTPASGVPVGNILFESRPASLPLLSLGQLQHANLSTTINEPASPLGNSQSPYIHLNRTKTVRDRLHRAGQPGDTFYIPLDPAVNMASGLYDTSYLLNRALWDRYFVSTVPHPGTNAAGVTALPDTLPNTRHIRPFFGDPGEAADLADVDKAASRLLVAGGFNINSTSEQAWRAVLGGINRLAHEPAGTPDANPLGAALPRFAAPPAALSSTATIDWAFTGYRRLDERQIAALAANIVAEVRQRGPFVSLADFVNRRLKDNPATTTTTVGSVRFNADESLKGPLQNAIDNTPASGPASVNNLRNVDPFRLGTAIDAGNEYDGDAWRGGPGNGNFSQNASFGSPSAFAAQFLTQADVLSAIGAGLSARSDTFTVRTYGETQNPVTGEITGRAWCEAVVQRTVEPVLRKSSVSSNPDYNEPSAANDFGRRFKIISFRWLSASDI